MLTTQAQQFLTFEPENDISLTAFRLLIMDLLVLFHVMNEGMVNILQHFFDMSKPDAQRTLNIYRTFVKQTDNVVKYLSVARNYEHVTRLEIPTLKHAPTVLTNQLEDYVKDPDFEVMRQQYMAQQGLKKSGGSGGGAKSANGANRLFEEQKAAVSGTTSDAFPEPKTAAKPALKAPAPDMIDFFESIEQNQTTMNTNPFQQPNFGQQQNVPPQATGFNQQAAFGAQQTAMPGQQNVFMPQATGMPQGQAPFGVQPTGIPTQQTPFGVQTTGFPPAQQQTFSPMQTQPTGNPFAPQQTAASTQQPLQPNFTGAGFGGYTPAQQPQQNRFTPGLSSIPQNSASTFQPQSNLSPTDGPASTNPFRQSMLPSAATGASPSPFAPMQTGLTNNNNNTLSPPQNTNPFAKPQHTPSPPNVMNNSPFGQPAPAQPLMPAATGTNPFARPLGTGSPAGNGSAGVSTNVTGSTNPFRQSQFVNQSKLVPVLTSVPYPLSPFQGREWTETV